MMKSLILCSTILLSIAGCQPEDDQVELWWVNSSKVDCMGVGPMKCLQIQKGSTVDAEAWKLFYDQVEGFEYEPGYLYQLQVKVSEKSAPIPADASSLQYELIKVISKEKDS